MAISRRFPGWGPIAEVYAIIVLMIYSWTIVWFLWKLPSWLFFLNAGEILTAAAYSLATNLLESLAVLCAPIAASFLLPPRWFGDKFVSRAVAMVISGLGYMMYVAYQFTTKDAYPSLSLKTWSLALALIAMLLIVALAGRISFVCKGLEALAERATIFLFVYVPLSVAALLVVLVRWVM